MDKDHAKRFDHSRLPGDKDKDDSDQGTGEHTGVDFNTPIEDSNYEPESSGDREGMTEADSESDGSW